MDWTGRKFILNCISLKHHTSTWRGTRTARLALEKIDINGQAMAPYAKQAKDAMRKLQLILTAVRKQGERKPLSLVYYGGDLKLYKRKEGTGKPIEVEISRKFCR